MLKVIVAELLVLSGVFPVNPVALPVNEHSKRCQLAEDWQRLANRLHKRDIVSDYEKAIYKASTTPILLKALEDCIQGYQSLHKVGVLHRGISVNNLMLNEDRANHSWSTFLIACHLTIKEHS